MGEVNCIEIWNQCLSIIRNNVSKAIYDSWFAPTKALSLVDDTLTIEVPSDEHMRHLEDSLINILGSSIKRVIGKNAKLSYVVNVLPDVRVSYQHQDLVISENPEVQFPTPPRDPMNPFIIPGLRKLRIPTQLNPKYTLDNFIEGSCNRLARSAAESVAKSPGNTPFNPIYIYGGSGLGKTHLAQAIGNKIKELFPSKVVLYISAHTFKTQYMDAVNREFSSQQNAVNQKNKLTDFLHFYQLIDVLIVDDVQEFAGVPGTQNAFFHVFNYLHQSGHQLILTSDCPPSSMQGLDNRLLSRFKWGLHAELLSPDFETRLKLFKIKSLAEGIELSDEVIEYLATKVTGSVREIEGTLASFMAHSTILKEDITIDLAKKVTDQIVATESKELSVEKIRDAVCNYFKVSQEDIVSKVRKREIVQARQITMYLVRKLTKTSFASIGSQMGGKDHATVLHACNAVQDLIDTDKEIRRSVQELKHQLSPNV